jgi:hypothetical protein
MLNDPRYMAIDDLSNGFVYWTDYGLNTVSKVSKNGGQITELANGLDIPMNIVTDGSFVYWIEVGPNINVGGSLRKMSVNGGEITNLVIGLSGANSLVMNGDYLYLTQESVIANAVNKVHKDGHDFTTLALETAAKGIAVDETYVYWSYRASFSDIKRIFKGQ